MKKGPAVLVAPGAVISPEKLMTRAEVVRCLQV